MGVSWLRNPLFLILGFLTPVRGKRIRKKSLQRVSRGCFETLETVSRPSWTLWHFWGPPGPEGPRDSLEIPGPVGPGVFRKGRAGFQGNSLYQDFAPFIECKNRVLTKEVPQKQGKEGQGSLCGLCKGQAGSQGYPAKMRKMQIDAERTNLRSAERCVIYVSVTPPRPREWTQNRQEDHELCCVMWEKQMLGSHVCREKLAENYFVLSYEAFYEKRSARSRNVQASALRAQILKKIQDRLKFSISLENFNLAWNFQSWAPEFPTKNRGLVVGSLENFKLAWKFQDLDYFQDLGP